MLLKWDVLLVLFSYLSLPYLSDPPNNAPHTALINHCATDVGLRAGEANRTAVTRLKAADSRSLIHATWYLKIREDQAGRGHSGCVHVNEAEVCGRGSRSPRWSPSWQPQIFDASPHPPQSPPAHSSVEDEWEMWLFVPRGTRWRHHTGAMRAFESRHPPDVNLQPISYGQGVVQWEGKPISSPLRRLTDNYQSRRRYKHNANKLERHLASGKWT